ncbi:MAG: MFS transporter [Chloroflexi bacterium]|nr:MFS transporter [Chloroflexota bacterium]
MSNLKLAALTLIRVVINTAFRMIYPFLAVFARGLGVDIGVISGLVANRAVVGAATPFLFPFIETRGRRFGMALGLGLFVLAMGVVALFPAITTLGMALILAMIGKSIFDPSMTSHIADHVAYEKRGTAIALSEFAWSLAFILGIPFVGWLIAQSSWSAPFWALGILGLVALVFILLMLRDSTKPAPHADGVFGSVKQIVATPVVLAAFSIGTFVCSANEMVNLMFGVWLEDSFKLQIAALAGASAVIGLSELGGEGLVALFVDRIGKVRAAGLGIIVNSVAAILLPIIGRTEFGALAGLFFFFIAFEITIVSIIPLNSEVMPSARATTLAFAGSANFIGRAVGALLAPKLYALGFGIVTGAAVGFNLLALVAVWYVSKHHD